MKKALSLILALTMCLSLIPLSMTALAYGNDWIQLNKSNFDPLELFTFTVSGVTAQMEEEQAWIAVYKIGAPNIDYGDFTGLEEGTNKVTFRAPEEKGDYELRLFRREEGYYKDELITSVSFTVGKSETGNTGNSGDTGNTGNTSSTGNTPIGNEWIQANKSIYEPNEKMNVTFKGITEQMVDDDAWANIYKKGAAHDDAYGNDAGVIVMAEAGTYGDIMYASPESGEYEIRLYSRNEGNYVGSGNCFVSSLSFTVGKVANTGTISLDKTAYKAFDPIIVTFTGITQQMVTAGALVAIYPKGAAHGEDGDRPTDVSLGSGTVKLEAPNKNGEFEVRLYSVYRIYNNDTFVMSVPFTVSGAITTSGWAEDQNIAAKAAQYGLIPDSLWGADWTKPITRAEFAAVSVKLYECLADKKADPAAENPFTDTKDAEILKAFNIGVTNGTSATLFSPNDLLNREQAATMLTRALKTAYVPGWTLPTDGNYTLGYTMPEKFADDELISGWAKESVYFMVANKIINGLGNNMFGPRNTTERETAMGYANATREQALAIAVRMVENIKDKPVEFSVGVTSIDPPVAP